MIGYVLVATTVVAVNLLPAFGPPTWAVLVLFDLHLGLATAPLVLVGAASAATGRFVLASATRRLGGRILVERRSALEVARDRVTAHRVGSIAGLGLFALSPLPSGQLFVAAGLFALPLVPVTAAFFAGRIVSYAAYVTAASAVDKSSTERALNAFKSPTGIAVQVLLLAGLGVAPLLLGRRPRSSGRDTMS